MLRQLVQPVYKLFRLFLLAILNLVSRMELLLQKHLDVLQQLNLMTMFGIDFILNKNLIIVGTHLLLMVK